MRFALLPGKEMDEQRYKADRSPQSKKQGRFGYEARRLEAINKNDFSSQRGLMMMVGQRKRLLTYLSKHNLTGYRALIEKLGLRK